MTSATDAAPAVEQHAADTDPRVTCLTCLHAQGWRCGAWPLSGLPTACIGGIQHLPQHCPAWAAAPAPISDDGPGADWPEVYR